MKPYLLLALWVAPCLTHVAQAFVDVTRFEPETRSMRDQGLPKDRRLIADSDR